MFKEGQSAENGRLETYGKGGHQSGLQGWLLPTGLKGAQTGEAACCGRGLANSVKFGCAREWW